MPNVTYTPHPSSNKFPKSITVQAGNSDAIYFYLIPQFYVLSISSISVPQQVSGSNANTQYRWNSALSWGGAAVQSGNTRNTGLKSTFNPSRQILCMRVQCTNQSGTSKKKFTINQPTIRPDVTLQTLDSVNPGDSLLQPMNDLKSYLDTLATAWRIGTNITIPTLNEGDRVQASDWNEIIQKANALPHVSGLVIPSVESQVLAEYYNNTVHSIIPITA